jgi:DNA repair exonuclease SbcCD ATPase subunit
MIEVTLEEFEALYKEKLDTLFIKVKRTVIKLLDDIKANLIEIKVCMDHFIDAGENRIEEKAQRSLHFFSDKIRREIDEIEIPEEEMNHEKISVLLNSLTKLFSSINEIARKSLPKFQKEVQAEIKELNYITRKLGKKKGILDEFMRKKYGDLKEAEALLKKIPKMFSLKENIEHAKEDLDSFEKELEERNKNQEDLTQQLIILEKNELLKELEEKNDELYKLRLKINEKLSFKKSLKKMKFELEKGTIHVTNVDLNYIREFLKDSISTLSKETKDLTRFSGLLVQLRHVLEENKLNLKTEMEEFNKLNQIIKSYEEQIKEAGIASKLEDLKNQISMNTVKLEHLQNDIERKNKDYIRNLSSLKDEREEFQQLASTVLGEEVKINISFSF